jgi:hypothetical protein
MTDASYMARFGAQLVDNGYAVIPIMPGSKVPGRFSQGQWTPYPGWSRHGDRPTTLNEIEIWSSWPDCGIGIATGATARSATVGTRHRMLSEPMVEVYNLSRLMYLSNL